MIELKRCTNQEIWDDYILDNGGHPFQLWGWGQVKASNGWQAVRLFLTDDDENKLAAVQVLIKPTFWPLKSFAYVPRGPVIGSEEGSVVLTVLAEFIIEHYGSVALSVEPDEMRDNNYPIPKGWKNNPNMILPDTTVSLDLDESIDSLSSKMSKTTRQSANKALREIGDIRRVKDKETLAECLKIYRQTAKKSDFALHSDEYYYNVFNSMGENSVIYAAYHDKKPIAFLWLAISQSTAYQMYSGLNEVGRSKRANYALRWYCIQRCKEWGIGKYDFGGVIKGGVQEFKKGWSDSETLLIGNIEKPLSPWYFIWRYGVPIARKLDQILKSVARKILRK